VRTLAEAFKRENLARAWRWIRSNPDAEYQSYFRSFYGVYAVADDAALDALHDRLRRDAYEPSHACKLYLPKPSGVLRPYTLMTVEDQIVYQAMVNIVAERLLPRARGRYLTETFGHLYAGKRSVWFYRKWAGGYRRFNDAARHAVAGGLVWTASFDLTACYDSLDHAVLRHFLGELGLERRFTESCERRVVALDVGRAQQLLLDPFLDDQVQQVRHRPAPLPQRAPGHLHAVAQEDLLEAVERQTKALPPAGSVSLRVRCDRHHREFVSRRAVIPENAVRGGRAILRVGFEHLPPVGSLQAGVFMRVEARVAEVGLQQTQRLADRLESLGECRIAFQGLKICVRFGREPKAEGWRRQESVDLVVSVLLERPKVVQFAARSLVQTALHACQSCGVPKEPRFVQRHHRLWREQHLTGAVPGDDEANRRKVCTEALAQHLDSFRERHAAAVVECSLSDTLELFV